MLALCWPVDQAGFDDWLRSICSGIEDQYLRVSEISRRASIMLYYKIDYHALEQHLSVA